MARHPRVKGRRSICVSSRALVNALEARRLLTAVELQQIAPILASTTDSSQNQITLSNFLNDPQTAVIDTNLGEIDITLTPTLTPQTVDNFAEYAAYGLYDNTFIHRDVSFASDGSEINGSPTTPGAIIQGGGYVAQTQSDGSVEPVGINTFNPIPDEAATADSNTAGTIAMARTSDPNSATSQFFFNVVDNTDFDYVAPTASSSGNPGYAVFGTVSSGESVVNEIASLPTDGSFFGAYGLTSVPVTSSNPVTVNSLVDIESVTIPNDCSYSVTSAQPQIVNAVVDGDTCKLEIGHTAGTVALTVTATSLTDQTTASETFEVTVPPPAGSTAVSGPIVSNQTVNLTTANASSTLIYLLNQCTDATSAIGGSAYYGLTVTTSPADGTLTTTDSAGNDLPPGSFIYVPNSGFIGTDSFQYTVTDNAGITSAPATLTVTVSAPPPVAEATIGVGAAPSLHFSQPDGTVGVIRVTTGTAVISLTGPDPVVTKLSSGLYANDVNISNISITDKGIHNASLVIEGFPGPHQGEIVVGGIQDTGGIFDIVGHTTELTGTISAYYLGNMEVYSTNNATFSLASGVTAMSIVSAVDTTIAGGAAFRKIKVGSWTSDNPTSYYIEGVYLTDLVVHRNFDEGLVLTADARGYTLNLASIGGTVGGEWPDPWYVNGQVHKIIAAAVAPNSWSLTPAGAVVANGPELPLVTVDSLVLGGNVTGFDLDSEFIRSFSVGGDLTNSYIEADANYSPRAFDLTDLSVKGAINNTTIYSVGNISSIRADALTQSEIGAGVSAQLSLTGALIDTAADIGEPAAIGQVVLTARTASFSDARIAAAKIGALNLGTVVTNNGGVPIGISAEAIGSLRAALDSGGTLLLGGAELRSAQALAAYFASHPFTLGDFAIDLFPATSS